MKATTKTVIISAGKKEFRNAKGEAVSYVRALMDEGGGGDPIPCTATEAFLEAPAMVPLMVQFEITANKGRVKVKAVEWKQVS